LPVPFVPPAAKISRLENTQMEQKFPAYGLIESADSADYKATLARRMTAHRAAARAQYVERHGRGYALPDFEIAISATILRCSIGKSVPFNGYLLLCGPGRGIESFLGHPFAGQRL
jgi:hypothetical protein